MDFWWIKKNRRQTSINHRRCGRAGIHLKLKQYSSQLLQSVMFIVKTARSTKTWSSSHICIQVASMQGTKQALITHKMRVWKAPVSALVHKSKYCLVIRFTGLAVICNLSQNRSAINICLRTLFSDLGPFGKLMIYQHFGNWMLFNMYRYTWYSRYSQWHSSDIIGWKWRVFSLEKLNMYLVLTSIYYYYNYVYKFQLAIL